MDIAPPDEPASNRMGADATSPSPESSRPLDGKQQKASAGTTIRVVDARRPLSDITLLDPEELRTILETLVLEFEPAQRQALLGLERVAADLRALRGRGPAGGEGYYDGPQQAAPRLAPPGGGLMDEVSLRQLLYSDAVTPVIAEASATRREGGATGVGGIRVRPGTRKAVYVPDYRPGRRGKYREAAVAAEQSVVVEGLVLNPRHQGGLVLDVLAGGVTPGLWPVINTGTFSAAVLSVLLSRKDPATGPWLYPDGAAEKPSLPGSPQILPFTPELVGVLRRQLGAAMAYHLSGAGAALALDAATAMLEAAGRLRGGAGVVSGLIDAIVTAPTRGVVLPTRGALELFMGRIAEVFPGVAAVPDAFVFALTPLVDAFRVGAFGAYYATLAEGREAPGVSRFLERAAIAQAEREQLAALDREIFAETAQARQYIIIIEDKFGAGRAKGVATALETVGPTAADSPQTVLAQLQKREREVVTTEYANRKHEWEARSANKCPHVRLASRLRSAKTALEATQLLKELSAYFKPPDALPARGAAARRAPPELEWTSCKSCGFRVICPHVVELIQMQSRNRPYDEVRTRLMKYAIQYSERSGEDGGPSRDTYAYFCRICSEQLAEFTGEDRTAQVLGAVGNLDDHVRKVIWIEAVNAAELVRFPIPIDPRKFAGTAVGVCHPLLLAAEANLIKRGRRRSSEQKKPRRDDPANGGNDPYGDDEEAIDPRTHLYVALFVYAYVLNLIRSSHAASEEESRRLGFEGVGRGAPMSKYAEGILSSVLKKYAGLISRIEDITPEFIADRFREAYRLVVGEEGPQELTSADEAKIVVNEIVSLSPVYHYGAGAARVFGALPVARPLTPAAARREFETVLGRTLPEVLEDRAADSKESLVQLLLGVRPSGRGSRRVAVEYPRGSDPLYIYSEPAVNFLLTIFRAPAAVAKSVDMGPFDGLAALAEAHPACAEVCIKEAVGGRAAPRKRKVASPEKAKPAAAAAAGKKAKPAAAAAAAASKKAKPAAGRRAPFDPGAFLRGAPELGSAAAGLYLRSYELFTEYVTGITSSEKMEAFQARLARARTSERGFLLFRSACAVKNYRQFGFSVSRRFGLYADARPSGRRKNRLEGSPQPTVPLTYLYDEKGLAHTWAGGRSRGNIYLYSAPAGEEGPPVELTHSAIVQAVAAGAEGGGAAGPTHGRALLDLKCSVCGVLLSEIHTLDEKKARVSLQALSEFSSFFSFYDSRCPADGLHDFAAGGAARECSKCGISEPLIFGYGLPANASAARAYYDKYLERYNEQRGIVTSSGRTASAPAHSLSDAAAEALEAYGGFAAAWRHDYSLLVQAAELIGEPVAALETLGATEGREYGDVLSGAGAPPPPSSADDPRLLAADSDVRVFITAYNRLRYIHRFSKAGPEAEAVLQEAMVPRHEYESLPALLPDVFDGYSAKRLALLQTRTPAEVLLFTIESLARMALAVAAAPSGPGGQDWVPRLGQEFAKRALAKVVRSERLLAKNGPFNFKIFGEDDLGEDDGAGDFAAGEFGAGSEDVLAEIDAQGGEDGAVDAFSLEAVDIDDDDPNLEPD
jgi:hypothetical protein